MLDCAVIYTLFLQNKAQKLSYVNHKYCAHRWVAKDTWIFHFLFMCARSVRRVGRSSDRVGLTHKEYGDFTFTLSSAPLPPPPQKWGRGGGGCTHKKTGDSPFPRSGPPPPPPQEKCEGGWRMSKETWHRSPRQRNVFCKTFGEPDGIHRLDGNQIRRIWLSGRIILNTKMSTR